MRISDWSSDVCSSDLLARRQPEGEAGRHDARKDRDRDALLEIELGDRGDLLFVGKRRILARAGDRNDDDPRQRDGESKQDDEAAGGAEQLAREIALDDRWDQRTEQDRKSTRLTSSNSCAY